MLPISRRRRLILHFKTLDFAARLHRKVQVSRSCGGLFCANDTAMVWLVAMRTGQFDSRWSVTGYSVRVFTADRSLHHTNTFLNSG